MTHPFRNVKDTSVLFFCLPNNYVTILDSYSNGAIKIQGLLRMCNWRGDIQRGTWRSSSRQVCITAATSIYMHGLTNKYTS
jgi:hypothetical protein